MGDQNIEDESDREPNGRQLSGVGLGYAAFQIAKALNTAESHPDAETRARAEERAHKWHSILKNMVAGSVEYGSRTPLRDTPIWTTPEVATGGFATGRLMAGGSLQEHEVSLLATISKDRENRDRAGLNAHFLTEDGFERLSGWLRNRTFDVNVPEEGALLAVVWLARNGHAEAARKILDEILPFFDHLRFFPIPLDAPRSPVGAQVHLQDVGTAASSLASMRPNRRILAQKETVNVWAPLHDRVVALFLETVIGDWPCQRYPADWAARAKALLTEYDELRLRYPLCRKTDDPSQHYAQLRGLLAKCAEAPKSLTGREVGRIRLILSKYRAKRGDPGSVRCLELRKQQASDVAAATFEAIGKAIIPRLSGLPQTEGVAEINPILVPVTQHEALASGVPVNTPLPPPVMRRVERCVTDSVEGLVQRGLVTSGDTIATLLPQLTSGLRSASFADPQIQDLYAAIYRAFRRRRSLLLLNLEKQVQLEELPWVAAVEPLRTSSLKEEERSRRAMEEVAALTLTSFPHAIMPNKLLQEVNALAKGAKLELPLVEEVAADIFMGRFSGKFLQGAQQAGRMLKDTLYANYYRVDYSEVESMKAPERRPSWQLWWQPQPADNAFAELCARRAGVELVGWNPATNGMVIEQQQILTTQNLAVLFNELDLRTRLQGVLPSLAQRCFAWVCRKHQLNMRDWHARLIVLKNTAYAWRQMLFYLALLPDSETQRFMEWADDHFRKQPDEFRTRFSPAIQGLSKAVAGVAFEDGDQTKHFLGWSKDRHWLLPDTETRETAS